MTRIPIKRGEKLTLAKKLKGDTDKSPGYLREYERAFSNMVDKEVRLLELGVYKGGSLLMWRDYFPKGVIIGLDRKIAEINDPTGRIHTYQGSQQDTALLTKIVREEAPDGFNIIIDDCSHVGELTHVSFWHLFKYGLKPGGIYAIEDWGTGYWRSHPYYPDGRRFRRGREVESIGGGPWLESGLHWLAHRRVVQGSIIFRRFLYRYQYISRLCSHDRGMVGFVKQLIDEIGVGAITSPEFGRPPQRTSRISRMEVSPGLVFVFKAEE